jgi:hypothetical protein
VETARLSFVNDFRRRKLGLQASLFFDGSITWISFKLGSLSWGVGACTLGAEFTSTSAVGKLTALTGE